MARQKRGSRGKKGGAAKTHSPPAAPQPTRKSARQRGRAAGAEEGSQADGAPTTAPTPAPGPAAPPVTQPEAPPSPQHEIAPAIEGAEAPAAAPQPKRRKTDPVPQLGDEYDTMSSKDMSNRCVEWGLQKTGTKAKLAARLRNPTAADHARGDAARAARRAHSGGEDAGAEPGGDGVVAVPAPRPPVATGEKKKRAECAAPPETNQAAWKYLRDHGQGVFDAVDHFNRASGPEVHVSLVVLGAPNYSKRAGDHKSIWNLKEKGQRPVAVYAPSADASAALEHLQMCSTAAACSLSGIARVSVPENANAARRKANALGELASAVVLHDRAGIAKHFGAKKKKHLRPQAAPDLQQNTVVNEDLVAAPAPGAAA